MAVESLKIKITHRNNPIIYYNLHLMLGDKKSKISIRMSIGVRQSEDSYEGTWKLDRRSQSEETTYCMSPTEGHCRKGKTIETVKLPTVFQGVRGGG